MTTFSLNSREVTYDGDPQQPLLWYLRDDAKLTGTKYGCGMALCGACTVHVNGEAVRSCQLPMSAVNGKRVTTIEGLDENHKHPLQIAWKTHHVPQCGYCQSGQIMQAATLIDKTVAPTDEDIDRHMAGNICRCGTYPRIRQAIKDVAGGKQP